VADEFARLNRSFNNMVGTLESQVGQIQHSEARYRALFQDSHCVMLLIDPVDGAILDANQAAAKYYGWSREVLTGMNIFQINTLTRNRSAPKCSVPARSMKSISASGIGEPTAPCAMSNRSAGLSRSVSGRCSTPSCTT